MASSTTHAASPEIRHTGSKGGRSAIIWFVIAAIIAFLGVILFPKTWPFTRESILQNLGEAADSTVTAQNYHATFFPPGCILEGLVFQHHGSRFITIRRLIVEGSYLGIFSRHVRRIEAIGAGVYIPAFGSKANFHSQHSNTVVDELVANGAYVEFESNPPRKNPFHFDVHEATLREIRWGGSITYHLKLRNPNPAGEISADGNFGAWAEGHPEDTPFSGQYTFEHADLGVYEGIAGLLSSQGQFDGTLRQLAVTGTSTTPDFEVKSSGHKVRLDSQFNAYVNAMNGDTFLNRVVARFGRTTVIAEGSIAHSAGHKGKLTDLRLGARDGRIEDVLGLFVTERSPMSGALSLQAKVSIPPDEDAFEEKVELDGQFGIDQGSFSKEKTQQDVDALSAGARGQNKEDPETVLTNLTGQVKLHRGVAYFSHLSFGIPGAKARMHGTYNILNYKVDLHGRMQVDTKISKTSSGVKALLLKIMDPIFKKRKKGEVVPIHIQGTYQKPQFGLDLTNNSPAKE
jgi:hypothetical protein